MTINISVENKTEISLLQLDKILRNWHPSFHRLFLKQRKQPQHYVINFEVSNMTWLNVQNFWTPWLNLETTISFEKQMWDSFFLKDLRNRVILTFFRIPQYEAFKKLCNPKIFSRTCCSCTCCFSRKLQIIYYLN